MSTDVIQNTNRLIEETEPIRQFIKTADINQLRAATAVDWQQSIILRCQPELRDLLLTMGFANETGNGQLAFAQKGRTFLGKLLLGLDEHLKKDLVVEGRYVLGHLLASGKNSLTFKATDQRLGRQVVLKFFRPGRGTGIIKNIAKVGGVRAEPVLVNPLDIFTYGVRDLHGNVIAIDVMVFPFVDGVTLREYLATERNSSPVVIQAFIEQACIALSALQRVGLNHGDLHPNNVMVTTEPNGQAAFRIIDVSYGSDEPSDYESLSDDVDGFKFILRLALDDLQLRLGHISLRRYLGARIFTLVEYILTTDSITFEEIYAELKNGEKYTAFKEKKEAFLRDKFKPPRDFGILRYEELSNPNVAIKLFHPYPQLFERLCAFGSTALFGHRGTGKSTYMAAMNFFPQAEAPPIDYRTSFGVLFSCRQGEFRKFNARNFGIKISADIRLLIKDILITKIIRKTLSSLAAGVGKGRLQPPASVKAIADVLLPRVQEIEGVMTSHQVSEIDSLRSTILGTEINSIDRLFAGAIMPPQSKLFGDHSLIEFFESVRASFSELNQARFSVLFDDAGLPNVPREVQALLCDLMASTNNVFCIKISAEKTTFKLLTSDKKPVERVHDVRVYTISDYFSMGGGFSSERKVVEKYFRELVAKRLEAFGFQSRNIIDYLGNEAMKPDELVARLVGRSQGIPVYGGWQIIWQIADRTMRHLIEMISAIFDESGTTPDRPPKVIPKHMQSRQIVRFSADKLRGLMFLPGMLNIGDRKLPLGKTLYEFAASFGKVSGFYLRASAGSPSLQDEARFDERLAIELDDTAILNPAAQRMLDELIRFAVVDDEKMTTAFDDRTRKPIYIFNRVYCPALRISYRRYNHWRLSSKRFEQFLLHPTEFVRTDQRLLKFLSGEAENERNLFN